MSKTSSEWKSKNKKNYFFTIYFCKLSILESHRKAQTFGSLFSSVDETVTICHMAKVQWSGFESDLWPCAACPRFLSLIWFFCLSSLVYCQIKTKYAQKLIFRGKKKPALQCRHTYRYGNPKIYMHPDITRLT